MALSQTQEQPIVHDAALPAHIAIIMDGNSRWAQARGISRARGHSQGAEALRTLLSACTNRPHIRYLTLYAFSTENWKRSPDEVSDLMNLLRYYVKREVRSLHKEGVRVRFIGQREALDADIRAELVAVEELTAQNKLLTLTIALSYGARQEMADAMRRIADKIASGALTPAELTEETIQRHLDTDGLPDPDLLIRTGGDQRLSNFLLWQSAYSELYFTETLWPDFDADALDKAIASYSRRERRYGTRHGG